MKQMNGQKKNAKPKSIMDVKKLEIPASSQWIHAVISHLTIYQFQNQKQNKKHSNHITHTHIFTTNKCKNV